MRGLYLIFAATLGPLVCLFVWIEWRIRRRDAQARRSLERAAQLGLNQPVSIHPRIDPERCIGSGACVAGCPEKNVLGLVGGVGTLINAVNCIGHGVCVTACPVGAIRLVFGSAERGVDIPRVSPEFETSVPGLFLAGEVGGMGLLRNAVGQGRAAMQGVVRSLERGHAEGAELDVLIIGAGPAGIAAGQAAREAGLRYLLCEQDDPGGAILHYPRGKLVLTRPLELPGLPPLRGPRLSKEQLMDFVEAAAADLEVRSRARVESVEPGGERFVVHLASGESLTARRVLVAVGRRGSPRKLEVPGEDQAKVVYQLLEPEAHRDQAVLVVGGGNSAVESALMLAEVGARVHLSYRRDCFERVAPEIRDRLDAAVAADQVALCLGSTVTEIGFRSVTLNIPEGERTLPNDAVIVQIGGTLPTAFLEQIGVLVEVHHGA